MSDQQQPAGKPVDMIEHLDKIEALAVQHTVDADPGVQFGLKHLKFRCPRCFVPAAVSNPGKYLCPHCATTLQIREKGGSAS